MNIDILFQKALEKGFSDVQVFLTDNQELNIEVFDGELEKYEIANTSSMTIKAVYEGKMAVYVTEVMEDSNADTIIDNLLANAKVIDSLDDAIIYQGDEHYETVNGLYNEKLGKLDVKEKIDLVKKLDSLMHSQDEKVTIVQTLYQESTKSVMLQNTKGLKLNDTVNSALCGANAIVKSDTDQRTGFDIIISNDFSDFNVEKLAKEIVSDAIKTLGAKPIQSGKYELIFDRIALATLFSAFQGIFSADNVQKGMSLLKGKLNTKIGSTRVNIVDDPFLKKSSQSRSFDDEGVATMYKELVHEGVLKTYLHNLVTAKKDGVVSTGNGFGGSVGASNLVMLPGAKTRDELTQSVASGLLITDVQGAHAGANPISGDFSLQAMGFRIHEGVLTEPVALITVSGNFIDFLSDVVEVGNDIKLTYYGITCPSVKVKPMSVSGL